MNQGGKTVTPRRKKCHPYTEKLSPLDGKSVTPLCLIILYSIWNNWAFFKTVTYYNII